MTPLSGHGNSAKVWTAWRAPAKSVFTMSALAGFVLIADNAAAADMTARDVTAVFFKTPKGQPADFSGKDLSYLDLAGLDFKSAIMAGADLYGVDLTTADLKGTNLTGARLDRATVIKADFSGANLERATMLRPSAFQTMAFNRADAPKFAGANLRGIKISARMDGADFRGADLTDAQIGPTEKKADAWNQPSSIMKGCDFSGARMDRVSFKYVDLTFAKFVGADLHGALFLNADLSKTDFSGADLTDADFTDADLYDANLSGVKGYGTIKGLDTVKNLDKAIK